MSEPRYDEDTVTLGYLNKALNKTVEEVISDTSKNYNIQPSPPYFKGDTWTEGPTGNMYRCIKDRNIGNYESSDWELAVKYDSDLNDLKESVGFITEQIDKKIESYRSNIDPSLLWSTMIEKEKHIGDFWYDTVNQVSYQYIKNSNNYIWAENDIPLNVYSQINGKKTIYTQKPNKYFENDMWIIESGAVDIPDGIKVGMMVFALQDSNVYNKLHWSKKDSYVPKDYVDDSLEDTKNEINDNIDTIIKPNILQQAKDNATALITAFNSGYFIKDEIEGCVYISDNLELTQAMHVWKWGLNGLGYSSNGISGPYATSITADGKIVADFITVGTLLANRIKGGTLTLGGSNGINGLLKVLDNTNQEMVNIGTNGITLKNGAKIVGTNGVISTLQIVIEQWQDLGFKQQEGYTDVEYENLCIEAFIPDNFTIISTKLKIRHAPVKYINGSGQFQFYGYARNINLYSCTASKINDYRKAGIIGGEYIVQNNLSNYTKIANALSGSGWTPAASAANENVQEITSIELVNYLRKGMNRLMIKSDEIKPAEELYDTSVLPINIAPMRRTGIITVFLNITGYTS